MTTTSTTTAEGGEPTTVVVTVIVTASPEPDTSTSTTTRTVTPSLTTNSGIVPPWRPTSDETATAPETGDPEPTTSEPPEDYCPTGYYQCLARQAGGCCRVGRDCATHDCPTTSSTAIVSDGATVLVPVSDAPESQATETCASGWFLCGQEAGPVAGCCPSGYECGSASCTTMGASQTGEIQKMRPDSGANSRSPRVGLLIMTGSMVALFFMS